MRLLTPKSDLVFKKLLAENPDILTDLINSVLKLPAERRIRSVEVKNPVILPEEITRKFIVMDIMATDESGCGYDIEMQARRYSSYSERSLYYVSRIYAGQLVSGEDYEKLKPVIGIHFLDYIEFPDYKDFHFCFEMRDVRHPGLRLTGDMTLHIFELPKFGNMTKTGQMKDALSEWLHFFNNAHRENRNMRAHYTNPAIRKAFGVLETLSADEKTRMLTEIREKAMISEALEKSAVRREGFEEGEKKGEKKGKLVGKIHFAQKLLKYRLTPEKELFQKTLRELGIILKKLEAELKIV
jgi:predicted transposase/invertase (TIGR01784 family)